MQEEVENRSVNLAITTTKLSARAICSGIRNFERIARRYGVDFAVTKDKSVQPPRYTVFFKAKDADALTSVHKAYSTKVMKKRSRPSVLAQLQKFKALAAEIPRKVREKIQERGR